MLTRTYDPEILNKIINDAAILPYVRAANEEYLDATEIISDHKNVCLMGPYGGFFCIYIGDGVYEGHTHFLPEGRGREAVAIGKEAIRFMFDVVGAKKIIGYTPLNNRPARMFNRFIGMKVIGVFPKQFIADGPFVDVEMACVEKM